MHEDWKKNSDFTSVQKKTAQPCYIRSFMKGAPGLVMGPCIVDRIVIREVQFQLEVNRLKGNFGWAWPMWEGHPRIDRIVIRETDRHRAQTMTNDSALACLSLKSVRIYTIFDLIQDIIGTNLRTRFHDDQTINVASRVLTRKNAEPTGSHVFQPISIMFELSYNEKNAPPPGSRVFQANVPIFKLIQDIIETNLLTKFHEDWTMRPLENKSTALREGGCGGVMGVGTGDGLVVSSNNQNHFQTHPRYHWKNVLTKFHENLTINVASRENAPPHKCHVFQPTGVILKLVKDIIGLNLK
ncbi:hypothetical protein DPMN_111360 [Dreissena polymorpha]|uniref:Uncharacterized protein n=1 Tax=Dreissena polymorpha TaxID=45954 RepID=A0A9D4KEY9_DREPO|nr:hypothetical protein DPMN_111360 [Dreissena polymorpha]